MSSCAAISQTSGGGGRSAAAAASLPVTAAELIALARARLAARAASVETPVYPMIVACGCISCKRGKPIHCVIELAAGGGGGPITGPQTYYVDTPEEAERVCAGRRINPLTETLACYLLRCLAGPGATAKERDAIADEIDAMYKVVADPKEPVEEYSEDEDDRYDDGEDEEECMKDASDHIDDLWKDYRGFTREDTSHRALRRILLEYVNDSYSARLLLKKPSREHTVQQLRNLVTRNRFLDSIHSEQSCAPGQPWVSSAPLNRHAWDAFLQRLEQIKRWPGYES